MTRRERLECSRAVWVRKQMIGRRSDASVSNKMDGDTLATHRTFPRTGSSLALLCLLLCACPLMRGSVHWWGQLGTAIVAAIALLLAAIKGPTRISGWLVGLAVLTIWTVIQLIPLPPGIVRMIAPDIDALSRSSLSALGLYDRPRSLSLDPGSGLVEVCKALACTCAALATALVIRTRGSRSTLWGALVLTGTAVALTGLVSAALTYGDGTMPPGPFGNPNHQAGFLNLCAWPALGFALEGSIRKRPYWLTCYAVIGIGIFLSLSRGGIGSFFAGLLVFVVLHLSRRTVSRSKSWTWWVTAAVSAILCVICVTASRQVIGKLWSVPLGQLSTVDKIMVWPVLVSLITKFPLFGIGRGAFSTTFPVFKNQADAFTWTHAENEWLQIPIEIGIPAGLLLIGSFAWIWVRACRDPETSSAKIGILAGMAALVLQNTVDFSFEVLGVALPFVVATASLSRTDSFWQVSRWPLIGWACLSAVVSPVALLIARQHSPEASIAPLTEERSTIELENAARRALTWHPVDYLPHAIVGARLANRGECARAEQWLARATLLNPTAPEPHLFLGSCLNKRGIESRSLRELRLAYLFGRKDALAIAMEEYRSIDVLLKVVPELPDSLNDLAAHLANQQRLQEAEALFKRVWMEYADLIALARLGDVTLALGNPQGALEWTRLLHQKDPRWLSAYLVGSRAHIMLGNFDQAAQELAQGIEQLPGNPELLLSYGDLLIQNRQFAAARKILSGTVIPNPRDSARLHRLISQTLEAEGRISEALTEMISAGDADPSNLQLQADRARLMAVVGK
jgi:tetratricopeptide (TPR) repeat protein